MIAGAREHSRTEEARQVAQALGLVQLDALGARKPHWAANSRAGEMSVEVDKLTLVIHECCCVKFYFNN